MNTKLTLTLEETVIIKAKKYAKTNDQSVSDIVENYLKTLTSNSKEKTFELTPIVKSLKGSFKTPKNLNYKKELTKKLTEKYL
jgi:hypothetical protein